MRYAKSAGFIFLVLLLFYLGVATWFWLLDQRYVQLVPRGESRPTSGWDGWTAGCTLVDAGTSKAHWISDSSGVVEVARCEP